MSDELSIPNPGYRGKRAGRYGLGPSRVRPAMDPDTRRLVMFAGGLGAVLVVLIGASAMIGHRSSEIPVVAADPRPIRVKPENPGGMKIDGAENDVFSGGSDTADSKLAPPPEKPDAKALRAAATPTPIAPAPASPAVTPPSPPAKQGGATGGLSSAKRVAGASAPGSKPAIAANAPLPKPAAVASTPAPRPAIVAAAPASRPVAPAPAKPQIAAAETHPPASGHEATVQFAALPTEEAARDEWQQLSKRMPDLMNRRRPEFSRTGHDGHVLWRVRTTGFADVAEARNFCDHVRAKGGGCSIADF